MCSPVIALGVASQAFNYIGQSQAAKAQESSIKRGYQMQLDSFAAQRAEINDASEAEMSERVIEAQRERGRLRVASGESGLSGTSFDNLEQDLEMQTSQDLMTIERNNRNQIKQNLRDAEAAKSRAQNNAISIDRASLVGTGLSIAGTIKGGQKPKGS